MLPRGAFQLLRELLVGLLHRTEPLREFLDGSLRLGTCACEEAQRPLPGHPPARYLRRSGGRQTFRATESMRMRLAYATCMISLRRAEPDLVNDANPNNLSRPRNLVDAEHDVGSPQAVGDRDDGVRSGGHRNDGHVRCPSDSTLHHAIRRRKRSPGSSVIDQACMLFDCARRSLAEVHADARRWHHLAGRRLVRIASDR